MVEIIANDILNGNIVKNLIFFVIYEFIVAIVSYKILERYSLKECFVFNLVFSFIATFIKLSGINWFKILIISFVQSALMLVSEKYIYDKDYDIRDYMLRATVLNILALGAGIASCILWVNTAGAFGLIKLFGLIITFILGINIIGYALLSSGCGNGVLTLVQSVLYVIALFLIFKSQNMNFDQIFENIETTNNLLKLIGLCLFLGITASITSKSVYDETGDMEMYLLISTLKTYAVDLTTFLVIFSVLIYQISEIFLI